VYLTEITGVETSAILPVVGVLVEGLAVQVAVALAVLISPAVLS
jgi:hypothetical protein